MSFFEYLNSRHPNIKFTMETEIDKQLPFLDLFISKVENNLTASVLQKSTYTRFLQDFTSFTSRICKIRLIKYIIDTAYKINIT